MRRWVGCVRIDGFYAHIESAHGMASPFAVVDGSIVLDACPAARSRGVRPGVPLAQARRLCAGLKVVPCDHHRYRAASRRWMSLGLCHAPWMEPLSQHEAFLDMTGHPDPDRAISRMHASVSALGFTVRAAAASNKLVARAATMVPDTLGGTVTLVPRGAEAAFLAPWPVATLWPLDAKTIARLERLEYASIAELASATVTDLVAQIGRVAPMVFSLAHGRYPDPVQPLFPETVIRARVRWVEGLERRDDMIGAVGRMAEKAARQLGGRCCRTLCVALEIEGGGRLERRETRRVLDAKRLAPTALRLAERLEPDAPVTGVAVIAAEMTDPPPLEGDLFSLDKLRRRHALEEAFECLEERYGRRVLFPLSQVAVPWRERAWAAFWERVAGVSGRGTAVPPNRRVTEEGL